MEFRLRDEDRERLGGPEWLPWSPMAVTINDLDELVDRFDFDPDDWPTPFFGELTLEQAGDPEAQPKSPRWQRRAAVWMALRQNGIDVSWDDVGTVRIFQVESRVGEPGKADPTTEPSTIQPSTTSTD